MRPRLSWADLRGRRVGVWGLGVEGHANILRLVADGIAPQAIVDDRGPAAAGDLSTPVPVLTPAAGGLDALAHCDVVVKSPGISRYGPDCRALLAAGVAVVGGLGLWLEGVDRRQVLCVTGTKGKSTTTAIAGHLLGRWGYDVIVGGNIGVAPWDPETERAADFWMIEVSSYQATDVSATPPVVAVTALHADHLNWHGDEQTYVRDKLSLCTQPGASLTVANGEDPRLRARRDLLGPEVRWVTGGGGSDARWAAGLQLVGRHNELNALVAQAALDAMGVPEARDSEALTAAAHDFAQLESRLQVIGHIDGVDFVDDSLSTNVLPTLAAVASFPGRRVALLAGGFDRLIDYGPLPRGLAGRHDPTLVLTLFESGARIAEALSSEPLPNVEHRPADDLASAVREAFAWARPGGVVLLSPAAPSFGAFRDYRHRAQAFAEAMNACRVS